MKALVALTLIALPAFAQQRDLPSEAWPALREGPLCAQRNETSVRIWHPYLGYCNLADAPKWRDNEVLIDFLVPQEEISSDRHFIFIPLDFVGPIEAKINVP